LDASAEHRAGLVSTTFTRRRPPWVQGSTSRSTRSAHSIAWRSIEATAWVAVMRAAESADGEGAAHKLIPESSGVSGSEWR
jgi:hypothetical protein